MYQVQTLTTRIMYVAGYFIFAFMVMMRMISMTAVEQNIFSYSGLEMYRSKPERYSGLLNCDKYCSGSRKYGKYCSGSWNY